MDMQIMAWLAAALVFASFFHENDCAAAGVKHW